jgi:pyruvate dehydrogenase E2 component (dihydrolipoamide acetyltransferase)
MATDVILPALGMSQDTGKIVQWLKAEGEQVAEGEPLAEIETDKATVEIEAPTAGVLAQVTAAAGDDVPVGQVIATILTPAEASEGKAAPAPEQGGSANGASPPTQVEAARRPTIAASPLASRIAAEHNLDLSVVKPTNRRIQKADVLTYLQRQESAVSTQKPGRLILASPKARRLAAEQGKDLATIKGQRKRCWRQTF